MTYRYSAHELHELFLKGEISAQEIVAKTLARIDKHDAKVGASLSLFGDKCIEKAKALDLKRSRKEKVGKLAGVVIAIKDNLHKREKSPPAVLNFYLTTGLFLILPLSAF
jgi:aspartyl-tRNA(Asn)/glutamyl-tRNA(Gln) amidotransferase subunit A